MNEGLHPYNHLETIISPIIETQTPGSVDPDNLIDENGNTFWLGKSANRAASVTLSFVGNPKRYGPELTATKLWIINGVLKDRKAYYQFARVKTLLITINDSVSLRVLLKDTLTQQCVDIPPTPVGIVTKRFRFTILDTYPGKVSQQAALTELTFDGVGFD